MKSCYGEQAGQEPGKDWTVLMVDVRLEEQNIWAVVDSGLAQTVVQRDLVQRREGKVVNRITIGCLHGDTQTYVRV